MLVKGGTDLYRVDAWHGYDLVQFKHIDMFYGIAQGLPKYGQSFC